MSQKHLFTGLFCLLVAAGNVSCSSHFVKVTNKDIDNAKPSVPYSVHNKTGSKTKSVAEKKAWAAKRRKQHALKKRKLLARKIARKRAANLALAAQKKRLQHAQLKKRSVGKHVGNSRIAGGRHWKAERQYSLTGDFAATPAAHEFIQYMASRYQMDTNYLNKLFSRAQDLRRVALMQPPKRKVTTVRKRHGRGGSWSRYRQSFISPHHIHGGVQFWRKHAVTLQRTYQQYGIPPEYVVAILGVETLYGHNTGRIRVLDTLSTKAFRKGRRARFFRKELENFLLMAQREGLNPLKLKGSSAGAIGLCQFMPSNVKTLGVDQNNNGVCNLWEANDAIGSVANYLYRHGWQRGETVAVRARRMGKTHKQLKSGYKHKYTLASLRKRGVEPQGKINGYVRFLRMSTYQGTELWLGGYNFYVITRYNHSAKYALAVHQLAQEIKRRYQGIRMAAR